MNRKLCLLFLVGLAVALVKSETTIEVDENGDEYEVKKFNIQGRQLNGGRSQCVVTRRKRATQQQPMAMYNMAADEGSNDEVDDKNDGDTMLGIEQQAVLYYSPPTVNPTADAEAEGAEEEEAEAVNNVTINLVHDNNKEESSNKGEEDDHNEEDDDSETIEVVQLPQLPILGQLQSDGESVAAIASAGNAGQVGHISTVNTNGIVVVQSHTPPKVNPQTHAVFELVPVNQSIAEEDEDDDGEDNGADNGGHHEDDFHLNEEISPITTTAIWSTGDDNSNELQNYNDLDKQPVKTTKLTKVAKKPVKSQKKKKKQSSVKSKRKNQRQKKYSNKRRVTNSGGYKRRSGTKRPSKTTVRRPIRRRKLRRGYNTRIRPQATRRQQHNNNNNNNSSNTLKKNKNTGSNNNNNLVAKRHKNKKHAEVIDQGTNTFTRTMTMTQTGDEDGDKNVNCIFIRKDPPPPTTTPRPFWNILGRNANGAPVASGHYGKRKRVNVRFVAQH